MPLPVFFLKFHEDHGRNPRPDEMNDDERRLLLKCCIGNIEHDAMMEGMAKSIEKHIETLQGHLKTIQKKKPDTERWHNLIEECVGTGPIPESNSISLKSTIEELLGNRPPSYLNVRTLNALYLFSNKLEEWRKTPSKSPDYLDGLPTLRTVGDLTKWPKRKLLTIQNVGRKIIDYLEGALEEAGYQFKDEEL